MTDATIAPAQGTPEAAVTVACPRCGRRTDRLTMYHGMFVGCPNCSHPLEFEKPPQSRADRLRAMSDEELAKWFNRHFTCPPKYDCPKDEASCEKCFLYWLREEATE